MALNLRSAPIRSFPAPALSPLRFCAPQSMNRSKIALKSSRPFCWLSPSDFAWREIDLLEWQSFDFAAGTLRIMPTKWYQLKTNESASELPVEPEILELFRGWRARAIGEFVLESDRPPRAL